MPITFPVSDVERAREPLRMREAASRELLGRPVEAWGTSAATWFPARGHGLLEAVHWAFASHYPLVLTPDAVWLAIAQGFATHITENAERFRGKFVRHEGRKVLGVQRDDFVKGSPENPWPEVFAAFSDQIAEHIGRQRDLVVCDFSTTGPCERAASEVVLLTAMQKYFEYEVYTMCGIPEITLGGTVDDWRSIRRRAQALGEYELDFWLTGLLPVLDKLVATAEGRIDKAFWRSLFKLADHSGGPYVTGWINVLFPYLRNQERTVRNPTVGTWAAGFDSQFGGGPRLGSIPTGFSSAPFVWEHLRTRYSMEFLGGFVGVSQDADSLALGPAIGWAVRDAVQPSRAASSPPSEPPARRRTLQGPFAYGAMVMAGRVAHGRNFTGEELGVLCAILDEIDPNLECALFGDNAPATPYAPMSGELVVGIPLAERSGFGGAPQSIDSMPGALRKLRGVPASTWADIAEALPGGLGDEIAIHLGCFGDDLHASVVADDVELARVSARGGRRAILKPSISGAPRLRVERG